MANLIAGSTPIPTTKVVPAQNVTPVETHPTLTVRMKEVKGDGDGLAVINAHDFNPDKHEKVNDDGEVDENVKPREFVFKETTVEPDLDDNDLKELGPPRNKQEKDRLENVAKTHLAKADKGGRQKLRDELEETVGPDAMQGQQNLPPQMQPAGRHGPGVGPTKQEEDAKAKEAKRPLTTADRPAGTPGERDATKADEQQIANQKAVEKLDAKLATKDEPPLTPRK